MISLEGFPWFDTAAGPMLVLLLASAFFAAHFLFNPTRMARARMTREAARLGIDYRPPAGNGHGKKVDEGPHRYAGKNADIAWQLEVLVLAPPAQDNAASASRSYSRWTCGASLKNLAPTDYLLLMRLPDSFVHPGGPAKSGLEPFNALRNKVSALAYLLYVRSFFGDARAAGLAFSPTHRCLSGDDGLDRQYTIFCNAPDGLAGLSADTRAVMGALQELQLAVLWDARGLAMSCPKAFNTAADVARFAEIGVRLAQLAAPPP